MNYFYSLSVKKMMYKSINIQLWNMYINSEALEKQNNETADFCKKMGDENSARHFKKIAEIYKVKKRTILSLLQNDKIEKEGSPPLFFLL